MPSKFVYLLHFNTPLGNDKHHAQHYIGSCKVLRNRMAEHKSGSGARITKVLIERGGSFILARKWHGTRLFERYLKSRKDTRKMCPICNPEGWMNNCKDAAVPAGFTPKYHHKTQEQEPIPVDLPAPILDNIPF